MVVMVTVVQQSSLDGGYYSVPHREWKMLGMRDVTLNHRNTFYNAK